MKKFTATRKRERGNPIRTTAKGREIVASLAEAIEVERAGVPIESRFTVRTAESNPSTIQRRPASNRRNRTPKPSTEY